MPKFLRKDGKFAAKNGKLVAVEDPADCDCCGPPPEKSCGERVPKTASVSLCGIIDRPGISPPACMGGRPGFAAPFNQTVEAKLIEPVVLSEGTKWEGELTLPDGYTKHKVIVYRGTEKTGDGCDSAALTLLSSEFGSFGCAYARWDRNYANPLGGFGTWKFGARNAGTQLRIIQLTGGIWWDAVSVCNITFGGGKQSPPENPFP